MTLTDLHNRPVLVCGAGGFIGGHWVDYLRRRLDVPILAVDIKPLDQWPQRIDGVENRVADLRELDACQKACEGMGAVYNFACDMGGMGFIETHKAECMISVLINTHLLLAARDQKVRDFFFASSACVYNADKQTNPQVTPLKESDAYPAMPEDGYGWEKLFSERMCRHFSEDFGLNVRVARFHNIYGPNGTWEGGREKAPAAICRKVLEARRSGEHRIEIWGTGGQTRSFTYIDDCLKGIELLMTGNTSEPLNIGSSELVTIDRLVDIAEALAGLRLERHYAPGAPRGVAGRCSDNTRVLELFNWEPSTKLAVGLEKTLLWIDAEMQTVESRASTRPQNRPFARGESNRPNPS